ncbi:YicC family protein [bacterium]|nr:YicC family protein [bacterium]
MTGIGRASGKMGGATLHIEVKSVNHKFCEVYTRLPSRLQMFDFDISQLVKEKLTRGKIDVWMGEEKSGFDQNVSLESLKKYHAFLKKLKKELSLKGDIEIGHVLSGASSLSPREPASKDDWKVLGKLLEKAINDLMSMRKKEGLNLKKFLLSRLKSLEGFHRQIADRRDEVFVVQRDKLKKKIERILEGVTMDEAKLANEAAYYAEKSDISEELERLASHFTHMRDILDSAKPCGRPLDFLIQEMNREFNTIASKSQDASIAHVVVLAKSELEKIREQVQNIE